MVFKFLKKEESLVAFDIGASSIKLLEIAMKGSRPQLVNIGVAPLNGEIFSSNAITDPAKVGEQIGLLKEANNINGKRVAVAVPGPSTFTKHIRVPKMDLDELRDHVTMEASNFIPHNINAVRLDFHILNPIGKNQLEILVVAVKNEVVDSILNAFEVAGLEVGVIDVDSFAVQNTFEMAHPELLSKTVALINMGARYSSINICKEGVSLFAGDVPLGGRHFTEAVSDSTGLSQKDAEKLKITRDKKSPHFAALKDALERHAQYVASELNRQLSFFWNAAGGDQGLDAIYVTGGGGEIPSLLEEISEKTGVHCERLSPLKALECSTDFSASFLEEVAPVMGVSVGLALRIPGDRLVPDFH
jgi:type IV pilus assembly protein PilM